MEIKTTISRFLYEDMCCTGSNVMPISTVCNAHCLFCSNKWNPFPIYRCGFRPLDEVYDWLETRVGILRTMPHEEVRLSDVLPGRISEGEATLHPQFFEICHAVRSALPHNPLHITTNGSKLTEEFISKMAKFKPFHVWISYHSRNVDNWTKIYGLNDKQFDTATKAFSICRELGISVTGAMVVLPSICGYDDLTNTLQFFEDEGITDLQWWEPGYGKDATDEEKELLSLDIHYEDFLFHSRKKFKFPIHATADPSMPLQIVPYPLMYETQMQGFKKVMWLTAELNRRRLAEIIEEIGMGFSNEHFVQEVINHSYGGNIRTNGLLLIKDMATAVANSSFSPDLVIAPDLMLDKFRRDLTGVPCRHLTHLPTWWRR